MRKFSSACYDRVLGDIECLGRRGHSDMGAACIEANHVLGLAFGFERLGKLALDSLIP
jgi:hypothetical protein